VNGALQGWGSVYFSRVYDVAAALQKGEEARRLVEQGAAYQVFPVPTQPFAFLATSVGAGPLISEETVSAANVALWRLAVFNHFVARQTRLNEHHAAEVVDLDHTSAERRSVLARAAEEINIGLHLEGIGAAADEGGWWTRLTAAVASDIGRLEELELQPWWASERRLLLFDGLAILLILSSLGVFGGELLR
jgi:hypothetical protein